MFQNREIVRALFAFEETEPQTIASFRFNGFLVWPIVKSALCYRHLKKFVDTGDDEIQLEGSSRVEMMHQLFSGVGRIFLKKFRKGAEVLFLTKSVDKLARVNGRYFNFLVDGMITRGVVSSFLYSEEPVQGDYRTPATVNADIKMEGMSPLISYFRKTLDASEAASIAQDLAKAINDFFQSNQWEFRVMESDIKELLVNFYAEHKASKLLLKVVRPKLVITSERIGTGFMAAAKNQGIPVIDLQHGLIDAFEPMYQYASTLVPYKKDMLLPDTVAVWGQHHQGILLQHNFWNKNEIFILGNQRMELNREKINNTPRKNQVLIATQWTVFNETRQLLEALDMMPEKQFELVLKLHPMEPAQFKAYFESFAATRSWVKIGASNSDIYELFAASKVVLGFNSASLIEAVALRTPAISMLTNSMPEGIYGVLGKNIRNMAIRTIPLGNTDELVSLLNRAMTDDAFYIQWQTEAEEMGNELFAGDVFKNAKEMISTLLLPGKFPGKNTELNSAA